MLRFLFALVILAAVPSLAHAQADVDVITLRDGSVLRGHVAELHPQQSVTLQLLTGEARTIAWSDVAATAGPSFAAAPAPPPPPSDPDLALLTPGPGRVPLVVDSVGSRLAVGVPVVSGSIGAYPVQVQRRLCDSPCTLYVPPGNFQLGVNVNDMSYTTDVDVASRGVRVKMHTPSRGRAFGGILLAGFGLVLAGAGGAVIGIGHMSRSLGPDGMFVQNDTTAYDAGGAVMIAGGVAMSIGGIYLLATNHRGVAERHELP